MVAFRMTTVLNDFSLKVGGLRHGRAGLGDWRRLTLPPAGRRGLRPAVGRAADGEDAPDSSSPLAAG